MFAIAVIEGRRPLNPKWSLEYVVNHVWSRVEHSGVTILTDPPLRDIRGLVCHALFFVPNSIASVGEATSPELVAS